jgi:uncharacterized protein YyaL (SSP411 family)
MSNHLSQENSPYLLQHADNPVDWYPWGSIALERARKEDKPVFLSIGYAACHWCHVMAHESFEDPQTAALMNEHFISIKVDREERPDVDSIYMNAVVSMTGQGGWPLSVFLTPDGLPFFGGTYFPPVRRYNMPSFRDVLASVAHAWTHSRADILQSGEQILAALQKEAIKDHNRQPLLPEYLEQATRGLIQSYDRIHGGWGRAPKFPQPMAIEFLLRRSDKGEPAILETAVHALEAMSRGGMYDVVGGGFARYSTDEDWRVPHFEKMLYDNAQLARVYLHAYLLTQRTAFRRIAEETLDFVLRELTDPQGGFYSSLDADSEGQEGKYYLWTLDEIQSALDAPQDLELFLAAYEVTPQGNFEGANILQRTLDNVNLAKKLNRSEQDVAGQLERLHKSLLKERQTRVRPATDDKVLAYWNGLMLMAFAEAGRYLNRPDYLEVAEKNARFLLSSMKVNGRLLRSWRRGQARQNAYLEDYAALIQGLLALYQSDPDTDWFAQAVFLANQMIAHYRDPEGGFFDTSDDHNPLLIRPKEIQDNATPSGSSLAAGALLQLAAYTSNGDWRDTAEQMIGTNQTMARRYPTAFAGWLQDLDFAVGPVYEVAILGDPGDSATRALSSALWSTYRADLVAAISPYPPASSAPPLLQDRPLLNGKPTAYVCQRFICQKPVNQPDELAVQLTR